MKNKLITLALLITGSFAVNAQMPSFMKDLKGLTDAINQQAAPAPKQPTQSSTSIVQSVASVVDVKLGTYVGVYKDKQFKDQFIIIKASDKNQLSFYVETVNGDGISSELEGVAKLKGDVFLHATNADSVNGECQITLHPKGNKLIVTRKFVCGMPGRSNLMDEYVFVPDYKPMIYAERERLIAEKTKLEKTGITGTSSNSNKNTIIDLTKPSSEILTIKDYKRISEDYDSKLKGVEFRGETVFGKYKGTEANEVWGKLGTKGVRVFCTFAKGQSVLLKRKVNFKGIYDGFAGHEVDGTSVTNCEIVS